MQRREAGPETAEATPAWAEAVRRGRHPGGADHQRFADWRTASVARLRDLLGLHREETGRPDATGTDGELIVAGDAAVLGLVLVGALTLTAAAARRKQVFTARGLQPELVR